MKRLTLSLALVSLLIACSDKIEGPVYPERQVNLPPIGQTRTISGHIRFAGTAPKSRDIGVCQGSNLPIPNQEVRVENGKLADVLVYIKSGLDKYTFPYNKTPAVIDQIGCIFEPHVLAVQTYQPITIKNSDPMVHNINFGSKLAGQSFVATLTPSQGSITHQVRKEEIGINVTCDIHAFMLMYVHALPHPFFCVSKADGTFVITDLPYGEYVIEAIHAKLGKQTKKLVVTQGGASTSLEFVFGS